MEIIKKKKGVVETLRWQGREGLNGIKTLVARKIPEEEEEEDITLFHSYRHEKNQR